MRIRNKRKKLFSGLFFTIGVSLLISSCQKDMLQYKGKEGVYFAVRYGGTGNNTIWPFHPYSSVHLANNPQDTTTIYLKVMVTGKMYNYPRPVTVEINSDSTTAIENVHYKTLAKNIFIPANAGEGYVPLTIIRNADLKNGSKRIGLRLLANEYLDLSFPEWDAIPEYNSSTTPITAEFDASMHTIIIDDFLPKPSVWSGRVVEVNLESGNWGEYSEKKITLMCEVLDLSYADFGSAETMPPVRINLIRREFSQYLLQQYNEGNPIVEDDGRLMFVQGVPWQSRIGIPWKK